MGTGHPLFVEIAQALLTRIWLNHFKVQIALIFWEAIFWLAFGALFISRTFYCLYLSRSVIKVKDLLATNSRWHGPLVFPVTRFFLSFLCILRGKYLENGGLSGHSKLTWPPYLKRGKGLCNYVVLLVICMKSYACVPSCIYILIIYQRHWKRYVFDVPLRISDTYYVHIYVMTTPSDMYNITYQIAFVAPLNNQHSIAYEYDFRQD